MLAEFTIIPIGVGESLGDRIARVVQIVEDSGLPYKANPMGTVVEGKWEEVMAVIKNCHEASLKDAPRLITSITIDERPGKPNRIDEKIKSVEKRLGKEVKK
jgi:uncharacterized protein (TIGR00106 family)